MTSPADRDLQQEYDIIKYALTFLLSNLEDEVIEDISEYIGTSDPDEVEKLITDIIENY
jgi:hypothetical protein